MEIIGLVIVAPGVAFGYVALTAYPMTWMTGIMAVAMLLYLAEHGRRILIPKGQRLSIAEWRKQHGLDDTTAIDMEQVKPAEAILGAPGIQQTRQSQWQTKAAPFLLLFAVVLIGLALYQAIPGRPLSNASERDGRIQGFDRQQSAELPVRRQGDRALSRRQSATPSHHRPRLLELGDTRNPALRCPIFGVHQYRHTAQQNTPETGNGDVNGSLTARAISFPAAARAASLAHRGAARARCRPALPAPGCVWRSAGASRRDRRDRNPMAGFR